MNPSRSKLSKPQVEKLRALVEERLRRNRRVPTTVPPDPPPRYDELFVRGQQWLDELACDPES